MIKLGVNIDHIATLREARKGADPDPLLGVTPVRLGGADGITVHLREDRRHINDRDLELLRGIVTSGELNLEMAATREMIRIALRLRPDQVTLVPEKRQELTTEGGLDLGRRLRSISKAVAELGAAGIPVSLFINPDQVDAAAAARSGATAVEIHTGPYANARDDRQILAEFARVVETAERARAAGLDINAGHGLNYDNVRRIAEIPELRALYIGHGIIARAVFVGLERAVREMRDLIDTSTPRPLPHRTP